MLPMSEVTRVLSAIKQGDPHAAEQLLPLVYDELRKLAAQKMAQEAPGQTPGEPGEVKVWDAQTGRELLTLKGHRRFVDSVVFSPDGKRLATLSRDQTVKVWDAQIGHEILTLKAAYWGEGNVAFSPDGKRLASHYKVWDAQTGEELLALKGHTNGVETVAFSPDGKRLASTSHGPAVKVCDAQTGQELLTFKAQGHRVVFSPDGHHLAIAKWATVKIWDATPLPEKPKP
jgi:WD40 repeat protein